MRKFGLNKSGYLISIAKDQYFYWTDLKKTDKSPHLFSSSTCKLLGEGWGRGQSSFPIFQFPLFRATPLSHSFTPFLKISSEPPFQPPPLKKRGRGVWTVLSLSLEIGQNSDRGISDFQISGQSLIKINCHNS